MRMKRTIAMICCALMVCALCFGALPKAALAASGVQIDGQYLSSTTPYYKDGTSSTTDPGGWTAWFTGDALQLRSISAPSAANESIAVINSGPAFALVLTNNANTYYLTDLSEKSAILSNALQLTGNGALSVRSGDNANARYGIEAGSVTLQHPASLTAAGYVRATSAPVTTADWSLYTITAGTAMDGSNAAPVTAADYQVNYMNYKYVSFTAIPQPGPGPGPVPGGMGGVVGADVVEAAVPRTGDETPLTLMCGLVLLAGTGLVVSLTVRRRKRAK